MVRDRAENGTSFPNELTEPFEFGQFLRIGGTDYRRCRPPQKPRPSAPGYLLPGKAIRVENRARLLALAIRVSTC